MLQYITIKLTAGVEFMVQTSKNVEENSKDAPGALGDRSSSTVVWTFINSDYSSHKGLIILTANVLQFELHIRTANAQLSVVRKACMTQVLLLII